MSKLQEYFKDVKEKYKNRKQIEHKIIYEEGINHNYNSHNNRIHFNSGLSPKMKMPSTLTRIFDADSSFCFELESYMFKQNSYVSLWKTAYDENGDKIFDEHIYTSPTIIENANCNNKESCDVKKEYLKDKQQ